MCWRVVCVCGFVRPAFPVKVNAGFFYSSAAQREGLVAAEREVTNERVRKVIELKKQVRKLPQEKCT